MATSPEDLIEGPGVSGTIEEVAFLLDAGFGLSLPADTSGVDLLERLRLMRSTIDQLTADESQDPTQAMAMANGLRGGRPAKDKPTRIDIQKNTHRILKRQGRVGR